MKPVLSALLALLDVPTPPEWHSIRGSAAAACLTRSSVCCCPGRGPALGRNLRGPGSNMPSCRPDMGPMARTEAVSLAPLELEGRCGIVVKRLKLARQRFDVLVFLRGYALLFC